MSGGQLPNSSAFRRTTRSLHRGRAYIVAPAAVKEGGPRDSSRAPTARSRDAKRLPRRANKSRVRWVISDSCAIVSSSDSGRLLYTHDPVSSVADRRKIRSDPPVLMAGGQSQLSLQLDLCSMIV